MKIRITQLDGSLPNLALMRLSWFHRSEGDEIFFTRSPIPDMFEPRDYDCVYGSSIFKFSAAAQDQFMTAFPDAILGGTGFDYDNFIDEFVGPIPKYDYSIYPEFRHNVGFAMRGCRFQCRFCVVPQKEGKPQRASSISE